MLLTVEMVVRHILGQKRSRIGFWFQTWNYLLLRLWVSRAWAGLNCKLTEIHLESLSLRSGRGVPPRGGGPYWRILRNSFSLPAHTPSSPQQEGDGHILLSVLLSTGPSHNPHLFGSQDPMRQVFLLLPLHRGGSWRSQRLSDLPKVTQLVRDRAGVRTQELRPEFRVLVTPGGAEPVGMPGAERALE